MKKSMIQLALFAALAIAACSPSGEPLAPEPKVPSDVDITFVRVDPLEKILVEQTAYNPWEEAEDVARGEIASFQFVLKSNVALEEVSIQPDPLKKGPNKIPVRLKAREKYIIAGFHMEPAASDALLPPSDQYPDCLDEEEVFGVEANRGLPVWVSYKIPTDVPAGLYEATVKVSGKTADGKKFSISSPIKAHVYNVTLPEQSLMIANWHDHKYLPIMGMGESCPVFSDRYYEYLKEMVHVMRDHGQTVYWLYPITDFISAKKVNGVYEFDYTNFDRTTEIFIKEGNLKYLEGGHLARRSNDWESDYWVDVPDKGAILPLSDPAAQQYLSALIPSLKKHLQEKGWWSFYLQHIGDEPAGVSTKSYIEIANFVKNLAPDITIMDAVHSKDLANVVDIWCPELDRFETDYSFYQQRKAAGDGLWYYTCLAPRGDYANRFLEHPLIKVRLLHWINFKYGATGYLHWGFNQDWLKALRGVASDSFCPGGDSFIVYPGPKKVYSSIRLEAMQDGINDYELLKLLARKNPEMAQAVTSSIIMDFGVYNTDLENFRSIRRSILEYLSE